MTLSNIGDVVLTFPVFDVLRASFPSARMTVVAGEKAAALLADNPAIDELLIYEKRAPLGERWCWLVALRRKEFDLAVDLRNSFLPFFIGARVMTGPDIGREKIGHRKEKHLRRLGRVLASAPSVVVPKAAFFTSPADERKMDELLGSARNYVVIAPGAADDRKRWPEERFAALIRHLVNARGERVVLIGDGRDAGICERIRSLLPSGVIDLCGRTTLPQLGVVLKRARRAVTNDSGIMHMASYLDIPVLALFGPTDPVFYGPWGQGGQVLKRALSMDAISLDDVLDIYGRS